MEPKLRKTKSGGERRRPRSLPHRQPPTRISKSSPATPTTSSAWKTAFSQKQLRAESPEPIRPPLRQPSTLHSQPRPCRSGLHSATRRGGLSCSLLFYRSADLPLRYLCSLLFRLFFCAFSRLFAAIGFRLPSPFRPPPFPFLKSLPRPAFLLALDSPP